VSKTCNQLMARPSAGGLLIPQSLPIAAVVDDLFLIWATMDADAWINLIWSLPLEEGHCR
jgi:hypothetical protein